MKTSLPSSRWAASVRVFLAVCFFAPTIVAGAPSSVERFDVATWDRLQKELPRPAVVVFTATWCASCPAVLETLARTIGERDIKTDIVAVVIDSADERELLSSKHYTHATRLFGFEGNEAALRHRVDPRWRGVAPYVALLRVDGQIQFVPGAPTEAQLGAWAAESRPGFPPTRE